MIDKSSLALIGSAGVLSLALAQAAGASEPAAPTMPPSAPPAAGSPQAAMEQHRADAMAERERRYGELRKSAAEVGLELPATPPWAQEPGMPPFPTATGPREMTMPEPMSQEEWEAMRLERWEAMRGRAAENGVELPESPPWKAAEERRKATRERMEQYRETIEQLTDEQKEAVMAMFGGPRGMGRGPAGWTHHGGCRNRGIYGRGYGPGPMWPGTPGNLPSPMSPQAPPADAPAATE